MNTMLYADWVVSSFPVIRIVLFALMIVCAIALVVLVLMQSENAQGTDVLTGGQDSYYSQNKGASRSGKIKTATIIFACVLLVLVILYIVSTKIYPGESV